MTSFRIAVTVLAVLHAVFAGFTALVGAFANGGDVWQRLLVILLHPLGAAGVLLLVLRPRLATTTILALVALLTMNVIADLGVAQLMAAGSVRGDWELALTFSVGSGHRDYLRAGAAAHGPRNGRVRLRPEPETLWSRWRPASRALAALDQKKDRGISRDLPGCDPQLQRNTHLVGPTTYTDRATALGRARGPRSEIRLAWAGVPGASTPDHETRLAR